MQWVLFLPAIFWSATTNFPLVVMYLKNIVRNILILNNKKNNKKLKLKKEYLPVILGIVVVLIDGKQGWFLKVISSNAISLL